VSSHYSKFELKNFASSLVNIHRRGLSEVTSTRCERKIRLMSPCYYSVRKGLFSRYYKSLFWHNLYLCHKIVYYNRKHFDPNLIFPYTAQYMAHCEVLHSGSFFFVVSDTVGAKQCLNEIFCLNNAQIG